MLELMCMTFILMFSQSMLYKKEIEFAERKQYLILRIEELMKKQKKLDSDYSEDKPGIYVIPEIRPRYDNTTTKKKVDK